VLDDVGFERSGHVSGSSPAPGWRWRPPRR
jgi:hypothetical protein